MNIAKNDLGKSQVELTVEFSWEEFKPFLSEGAILVSREVNIKGFRPGKAPYEILKSKIGEMTILEEAARLAISKTVKEILAKNLERQVVGQPQADVLKLAPDNPFVYKITAALLPAVDLGDYKNVKLEIKAEEVKEEEAERMLNYLRERRAKEAVVERPAGKGDKLLVDIEMFLDKVPLEGGQSRGVAVILGQDYILPGFDKSLFGAKKNEEREFSLIYPSDHHLTNLAGKSVEFKVKILEVLERRLPEVDDKFAAALGSKNVSELKKNIKIEMENEKKERAEQKGEAEMLERILAKTKFGDLPEILINHETETMLSELEHEVTSRGGRFADYLSSIKKSRDQLVLELLPEAVKRVKSALVVREISLRENISASEEEVEEKIAELLKQYKGYGRVEERIREPGYEDYLHNILTNRKVMDKLKEWNSKN